MSALRDKLSRLSESPSACLLAWTLVLAALFLALLLPPSLLLRAALVRVQFWWLEAVFAVLLITSGLNLPPLVRWLRDRRVARGVLAWSLVAMALTAIVAPRIPRMFYDEQIYQNVAQNMTDLHRAQFCNEGVAEYGRLQCPRGEYNKEPYAWPHALSVGFRLFGVHQWIAHALNNVTTGAFVWAAAIIALGWTDDRRAALAAAAVAGLIPQVLRWGNTGAAEPLANAAAAWAVAAAVWFVRTRTGAALAWTVAVTAWAMQVRPESLLLMPIVALTVWLYAPDELRRIRTWWWALAGVVLCAALAAHLVAVRHESWQATGPRLSIFYIPHNFPTNALFFLGNERFPIAYSGLALVGLLALGRRAAAIVALWFAAFWAIFVVFYAGSFDWGANVRYSLMVSAPIAVAAGAGFARIVDRMPIRIARWRDPGLLLFAALAFQFLWYLPQVRDIGEESWAARADVEFARAVAARVPADSMILTQNPNMFLVWGRNAAQLSLVTTSEAYVRTRMLPRYRGGVYVHWNFWCNIPDQVQIDFCTAAIRRFPAALIDERMERDFRFALYRISDR